MAIAAVNENDTGSKYWIKRVEQITYDTLIEMMQATNAKAAQQMVYEQLAA